MPPLRVTFLNEGTLGTTVMGHARAGAVIERSLASHGVVSRFVGLPPFSALDKLATVSIPILDRWDLDLHATRWHLTQGVRARRVLRRDLAEHPADVVHIHSHTIGLLAGREMRAVPTVLSVDASAWQWHAMGVFRRAHGHSRASLAGSLALERRAAMAARRVLTYSRWAADGILREAPRARVEALHPGLDLERFHPAPREPRERLRVLFVGGRFHEKGGDDLVQALEPRLGRDVELDVVSPAHLPPREGMRVHRLGPDDDRLVALYQQADICCLPTRGDAAPWTVIEAMACGTPMVATTIGAIPEMLGDAAGPLVPPRSPGELRQALDALLADRPAREALGRAGRARAEARYDARTQAEALVSVLRDVAGAT